MVCSIELLLSPVNCSQSTTRHTSAGDFFVSVVRMDLLEEHGLPIPNTWDELVEYAQFFNGTDLNDDGDPNDFGLCHFPRLGAGYWDWYEIPPPARIFLQLRIFSRWWAEAVYAAWASFDQTHGINQGFFFNETTLEPRIGRGFERAVDVWKNLWGVGSNCEDTKFVEGRCAIGYGPPGE